jgi:hypothetical protein
MLRLLRRLLTALSLMALLAVLAGWTRAQWRRDEVFHHSVTDHPQTLRETKTTVTALSDSLAVERQTLRYELANSYVGAEYRRAVVRSAGTTHTSAPPASLAQTAPGRGTGGFRWDADPPAGEARFLPHPDVYFPAWYGGAGRTVRLALPWWFLALVFAILPALSLRRHLRRIRRRPGTCPQCGYDLRASPTRCPECGRPIDTPPTSQPPHS